MNIPNHLIMPGHSEGSLHIQKDTISLMAEAVGISGLPIDVAATISEDATLRLRQIIIRALGFMKHSNRDKLTCSDINMSLRWSDCQPTYGYECNPDDKIKYSYSSEAQVFKYEDEIIDLSQRYQQESTGSTPDYAKSHGAVPELRIDPRAINNAMSF
jgi:hypothetical protein